MSRHHWDVASAAALQLFEFGQRMAARRGLLLVDTKYEMGLDHKGNVLLVDEVHTPDSSRYWVASSYAERLAAGQVCLTKNVSGSMNALPAICPLLGSRCTGQLK